MNIYWLESSWYSLCNQLQFNPQLSRIIFAELVQAYVQTRRKYHNLKHIAELLEQIELLQQINFITVKNSRILQLITWFHDYIYVPQKQDCEFLSAIYAEKTLAKLGATSDSIQTVSQIIQNTQSHVPEGNSNENLLFLDLDLSILGADSSRYQEYTRAIRQEYDCFSDRQYKTGRKKILNHFLSRKRIYHTNYFHHKLESPARKNIKSELITLEF